MNWKIRSPGGGDNLFIASIVALDADTGHYVWHYQTTPGDSWDYDAATDMTLATLDFGGRPRKVLLDAPKNGFFYVIDRENGKLLSADKLGTVTWADHVDLASGRPVLTPGAKYQDKSIVLWPSFQAVHHWIPQSYSPKTGLMYEPTLEMPAEFGDTGVNVHDFHPKAYTPESTGLSLGAGDVPADAGRSVLKAWDPIARRVALEGGDTGSLQRRHAGDSGQPRDPGARGWLPARLLGARWQGPVVLLCRRRGHGCADHLQRGGQAVRDHHRRPPGRLNGSLWFDLRTFRLGSAHPSATAADVRARWQRPAARDTAAKTGGAPGGAAIYGGLGQGGGGCAREYPRCVLCHGMALVAGGIAPDLRASPVVLSPEAFAHIVHDGGLLVRGMPQFPELGPEQLDDLRHFIRQKARSDLAAAAH
jgi:quinohemoprotein ethanol dehydrogenase